MPATSRTLPEIKTYPQVWDTVTLAYEAQEAPVAGTGGDVNVTNASLAITAASLPLPAGASTAARQDTSNTALGAPADVEAAADGSIIAILKRLRTLLSGTLAVSGTFWQATQPVSAVALPLPTGAATLAAQTQPGVDIGDVTVNNAAGVAAVNVQDGGNSLTVDGTVGVNNFPATQAVSAASLPLPANAAQETGGNLATIKTNTDPLVVAAAGGYVRQDSTATIAKETGGNLATLAAKDFATQTTLATLATAAAQTTLLTELQQKTEPADQQHCIIDSMPPVTANSSANVVETYVTATYVLGDAGKALTQTPDGRLRVTAIPERDFMILIPDTIEYDHTDDTDIYGCPANHPWATI